MNPPTGRRVHLVRRDLLLSVVREAGRISRADLVRRTGMARMTVNGLVTDLLAAGLLAESEAVADGTRSGRPARSLTLGPAAGGVVGAVVAADGIRVAVAGLTGEIRTERTWRTGTADPAVALDAVATLIAECEAEIGGRVWSTVVGLSAPISGGVVQASSVLPGWAGVAPGPELQRRLGHRVTARNDADLCLLGEVGYGVAAGHQDVCYVRVASGIGCGLLLGGVVHHGATGVAGEIGHVQVDETGALCRCGNRGCLETIASPREILRALEMTYGEQLTPARAVALARTDATAERVLADAGRMIGRVVADLANTINPSLVVLDGPLIDADGPIIAGVRDSLRHYSQPEVAASTAVLVSALGGRSALLGAIAAALNATPTARGSRAFARVAAEGPLGSRERAVRRDMLTDALRGRGPTSRSDLVKLTGLPRAAVAELLAGLQHDGVVEQCRPEGTRTGRPSPHFRLPAGEGLLIGLSFEGEGIRVAVADGSGEVRFTDFRAIPMTSGDTRPALRALGGLALDLLGRNGLRLGPGTPVAMSVPAPVHPVTGHLGEHSVLPMFSGFSPGEVVAEVLGCPVRVYNNAQLAALAESRRGAARGARDLLYLSADQHAGAGILAGGRMHGGAIGYAGEVGHLTVRDVGPFCLCGRRGCLSAFLSPGWFGAILERRAGDGPAGEDRLLDLAAHGDRPAQRALLDAGRMIGRTVTPLCDVLNPAVVVVGGRFIEPGVQVVDGVREALQRHCAPSAAAGLTVVPAALGREAQVLGAVDSLRFSGNRIETHRSSRGGDEGLTRAG
ncbi:MULTISPECIES: ROK family transcriptional regulator [Actinoplanes]|uniref:ROK family transcriptional regulator n=1 Tax=Actinoplanes TaxID=1865 RepID=UPI000698EA6C|nr:MULTISPECIES: ROK family transcriptional regulator [Actinoplanes]GLY01820.1 hypothetical protein Acsp01_21990 [Actinoplanes sp. NBRC 101535]